MLATLTIFVGTPRLVGPTARGRIGRPRSRPTLAPEVAPLEARAWASAQPAHAWCLVSWRNRTQPAWRARFCATRVTPTHDWRDRRLAPEGWLLCERGLGARDRTKYYLVHLPATASLRALVRLTHQRWAIEQQDQELKDELGLDHFEGRSWPGDAPHYLRTMQKLAEIDLRI